MVTGFNFSEYVGFAGLLSQADKDQGDTAQRVGTYRVLAKLGNIASGYGNPNLQKEYWDDYILFKVPEMRGWYRRTPDPEHWGSNPKNFSRDQKSILMLSMAAFGDKRSLKDAFMVQVKRFGFHQNTRDGVTNKIKFPDITLPAEIGTVIRGLDISWLSWLLYFTDLCFFVDLALRKKQPWDYDNMLALQLFYAVSKSPTFVGKWAFKKYQRTDFIDRLYNYHCTGNGIKPLYDLFVHTNNVICGRLNYEKAISHHSSSDSSFGS